MNAVDINETAIARLGALSVDTLKTLWTQTETQIKTVKDNDAFMNVVTVRGWLAGVLTEKMGYRSFCELAGLPYDL